MYAYAGGCLDEEDLFLLEELGDRERRCYLLFVLRV